MKNLTLTKKSTSFLLVSLGIILWATPSYAQWNIGGLLNINNANVKVDPHPSSEDYSSRIVLGIGAVLDRPITGQLDLHAQPMYLQKGSKVDDSGNEVLFKTAYFELPVMIRYNFQTAGIVTPYAMAGPTFGYLLSAKFEAGGDESDRKDEFKSADFGVGFGGGAKIPKDNLEFFAEARYVLGLANTNDHETDGTTVKNRGIQIVFGVTVPFER